MKKASANTNRPLITSPCGDALDVSLISPPLLTAARLVPPSAKQVTSSTGSQYAPPGLVCPAITPIDRHKQRIKLAQNGVILFIGSTLHVESSARRLIHLAELIYGEREHDKLAQIGEALSEHRCFESIGAYYQGLAAMRSGKGNLSRAQRLLEQAAEFAPANYKAKALLSLGAVAGYQKNVNTEFNYYRDALNIQQGDISTRLELNRAIAFNYTEAGEYHKAIALLESIAPVAKAISKINPRLYYDLLNNYAVNLCEVGRLREASFYAQLITATALAQHVPEWRETKQEIEAKQAEQEQRPLIIAAPQVQAKQREDQKEAREHFVPLTLTLSTVDSVPPRVLITVAKTSSLIQSRVYSCAPIH